VINPATGNPLAPSSLEMFASTAPLPPEFPPNRWQLYLLLSCVLALLLSLWARLVPRVWGDGLALSWMLIGGSAGLFMVFAWFFTDHEVARWNANLLLLHPLMLLATVPVLRKPVLVLTSITATLALLLQWVPGHQYTSDILATVLPLNVMSGLRIWKMRAD
jgi:hypothetical protein